jgi:signal transduction histidine kinase
LLLAARAESKEEQESAVRSAQGAIDSLERVGTEVSGEVSSLGLLQAIERAAKKLDSRIQVTVSGADSVTIPAIVAEAITEATLQAVDNAIQHSKASKIDLDLKAKKGLLDFTISDDGVGFRFDRISRYRIGIRISILGRLRSIGGFADVQSAPQEGTKVSLRWSNA